MNSPILRRPDYRVKRRRPMRYAAWVDAGDGQPPHRCSFSDVSESGARLVIPAGLAVPKTFGLGMAPNVPADRLCHVVWRGASEIGVRFDRPATAHRNLRLR